MLKKNHLEATKLSNDKLKLSILNMCLTFLKLLRCHVQFVVIYNYRSELNIFYYNYQKLIKDRNRFFGEF